MSGGEFMNDRLWAAMDMGNEQLARDLNNAKIVIPSIEEQLLSYNHSLITGDSEEVKTAIDPNMPTDKELQEMCENLIRRTAEDQLDDLYNKMGMLYSFVKKFVYKEKV